MPGHTIGSVTDLEAAWDKIHGAKPDGWYVGQPTYLEHGRGGLRLAADPTRGRKAPGNRRMHCSPGQA